MSEIGTGTSVVVVGGGVTGLSAAWWLARSGVAVTVIEKGIVGFEASGRNGGGCTHYQSPLFHEEQRLWPQMDELLGYPTEYQRGRIVFQVDPRKERFHEGLGLRLPSGYAWDVLDPRQVRELVPLAGDNVVSGVHFHFGGHANPQRTSQAYAWAAQDHGAKILQHTAVRGFATAGGRVTGVETANGTIGCDALVIAAGPQTGRLVAMLGHDLPMAAARAEMIVTEPLEMMPITGVDGNGLYAATSPMAAARTNGSARSGSRRRRRNPPDRSPATSPGASPSFSPRPPMRGSSAPGPASSRTLRTAAR